MADQDNSLSGQIQQARKSGYSDDEITSYLSKSHADLAPKIKQATDSGYKASEVLEYLGKPEGGAQPPSVDANVDKFRAQYEDNGAPVGNGNAYSDKNVLERGKGAVKAAAKTAANVTNVVGAGIPRSVAPGVYKKIEEKTKLNNPQQEEGAKIEGAGELLAPIPGLGKLKAAKTAGMGVKAAYAAAHGAIDVGLRSGAETGNVSDAAAGAATGAAMGPLTALLEPISKFLAKNARSQYAKVIHPTRMAAKELVGSKLLNGEDSDLVGRGVMATSKEALDSKFNQKLDQASKVLESAWTNLPQGTQIKAAPIARQMVDWIQKKSILSNGQPGRPKFLHKGAEMVSDFLIKVAPNLADADPHVVREFRQMLDAELHDAGLPINGRSTAFRIKQRLSNTIRNELNKQLPDIGTINKNVSFWASAADMMKNSVTNDVGKKEWHEGIGGLLAKGGAYAAVGGAVGYEKGGDEHSAFMGAAAGASFAAATRSTAWRTVSPVMKDRIAKLIVEGKGKYAADLATRAVGLSMVRTTKPYSSYAEPPNAKTSSTPPDTETGNSSSSSVPPK